MMREGLIISGTAHLVLILLAVLGLPERRAESAVMPTQVAAEMMTLEAFDALRSQAPDAPAEFDAALSAPEEGAVTAPVATSDVTPETAHSDAPDAPEPDAAPDLTAVLRPNTNVRVAVESPQQMDQGAIGIETALPDAPQTDGDITGSRTALLAPTRPSSAPRIDTSAAPKPPEPVNRAPEPAPEVADDGPKVAAPSEAAAPEEATTEIVPEAEPEEAPTSPKIATRPRGRPQNLQADMEARAKAEEDARAKAEAEAQAAEIAAAVAAAQQAAATPQPLPPRLGQDLNRAEAQAIGDAIGGFWNVSLLRGQPNYEDMVIVVRVRLTSAGNIIGDVQPVQPSLIVGRDEIAFQAARRAVLRAAGQGIPLPGDKFRDGDYLEIRFDPGASLVSLN